MIPLDQVFTDPQSGAFFSDHYGGDGAVVDDADDGKEIPPNAAWRRMTADDAADAGALALAMNNATNNASLVLAFELSKGGKVLLFVGDAQAGNWRSWSDDEFDDDGDQGHGRGSAGTHRALQGRPPRQPQRDAEGQGRAPTRPASPGWRKGKHAAEFVAMITAVEAWAHQKPKPDWNHPLPAIKQALVEKAGGRVLQTDSSVPTKPVGAGAPAGRRFWTG